MAILKCPHCEHSKEVPAQYADKLVKCPACGQAAKVYDTIALLTAVSEKMSDFKTELDELKQFVTSQSAQAQDEELTQGLTKIFREHRIAMSEFNEATKRRDMLTARSELRMQWISRLGIVGFLVLTAMMLFMIFQFTEHTKNLYEQSIAVNGRVKTMTNDLNTVMATNTPFQKELVTSVGTVQEQVKELSGNLVQVQEQLKVLSNKNEPMQRYYPYR
ncbi:hypothetical protein [Beggiatoa leptomitoformis]|uniref:Uncharacterized protein n=1 Tax=Beggiatoa leptomitoformis TaxID=288004 RepID=A0A2N9YGF9_9GAMM|nr:hypothetical protein [Beggiatoa leptomitoformis]ALG68097.1 hypothetical protein AL038_10750 [Beggiatoa leptomitoformis]AUI69608.1 hypothetical protein BLE401_13520 [Beggiatoa leptomitoformis]